jgi:hypothetical protein
VPTVAVPRSSTDKAPSSPAATTLTWVDARPESPTAQNWIPG